MKSKLLVYRFPLLILSAILIVSGCTKIDTTTIGSGILPVVDNINTFEETLDVEVRNYTDHESDSALIFSGDAHVLGHVDDPVFGKTTADFYIQPNLPIAGFNYPVNKDSLFLDSTVLVLGYNGVYGDSLTQHKINVYPVTDPNFAPYRITTSDTFQVFSQIDDQFTYNNAELLGTITTSATDIKQKRILNYKKDSVAQNQLRIRLADAFGRSFLDQDGSKFFRNDTTYREFFKGFAVISDPFVGGNALMYFQPANCRLLIYHRVRKRDGNLDTTVQAFPFNTTAANGNYIKRNRSTGEIAGHLDNNVPDNVMYLQGTPGTYARVKIPGLESLSNRIVHRAELVMKQVWTGPQNVENELEAPVIVYPEVFNLDSNKVDPFDSLIYNAARSPIYFGDFFFYVGGTRKDTLDLASNIVAKYTLNITRYVQGIITRRFRNNPLHLTLPHRPFRFSFNNPFITPLSPLAAGRLKAGGGNNAPYKMYLRIIYSKIQ